MIKRETKIRAKGSKQWVRLGDTFDISDWGRPADRPRAGPRRPRPRTRGIEERRRGLRRRRRRRPGGRTSPARSSSCSPPAAGYFSLFPGVWRTPPDTPWREIALGFVVLGLLLVRGWEPMRKLVRVLVLILTLGLFPLAEVLIFRGVPWRSLVVLFPAVVMGFGLFFFLSARYKPWTRVALNLFWIAVGAAGVVLLGAFPPPAVAAWMAAPSPLPAALAPAMLPGVDARAAGPRRRRPAPAARTAGARRPAAAAAAVRAGRAAPLGAPSAAAVMQEVPLLSPRAAEAVRAARRLRARGRVPALVRDGGQRRGRAQRPGAPASSAS